MSKVSGFLVLVHMYVDYQTFENTRTSFTDFTISKSGRIVLLFVLRFYGPVNCLGHVEPVRYPLTLFLDRLRPTKRLIST